jgi:hypothetical protein
VNVRPFLVVTCTRSPAFASRRRKNAPGPVRALSTWPAIRITPALAPGAMPSCHQPVRAMGGGTASTPLVVSIRTGPTGASMPSAALRTRRGADPGAGGVWSLRETSPPPRDDERTRKRRGSPRTSGARSGTHGGSRHRAFHTCCARRSSRGRSGSEGLRRRTSPGRRLERARIPRSRPRRRCARLDHVANEALLRRRTTV